MKPLPCYRDRDNGVRFIRNQHRHDCTDTECRGCQPCPAADHCTGRRNCTWHVAPKQLTCGRCVGEVRRDLRWIRDLTRLVAVQALNDGATSEAANLAGPSADYAMFSARRLIAKQWIQTHLPFAHWARAQAELLDDDDEHHPGMVLKRWATMLREQYGQPEQRDTIHSALAYLDRVLYRAANDPDQDFALLRAEVKKVRQHLEVVLHNDTRPDRGAPCPTCRQTGQVVRLQRHYAHWCEDETCQRFHLTNDASDTWRCPANPEHWWTQQGYADLLESRHTTTPTTHDLP